VTSLLDRPAPAAAPAQSPPPDNRVPKLLAVFGIAIPTTILIVLLLGIVRGVVTIDSTFPFLNIDFRWPQLLVASTPTGGDMGAHVLLPQILRDELLPSGRILGWSNDWYAGFPVLYFYFPLPALATVLLDVVLPYGVAFKIITTLGLVSFPAAVYFFVRSLGFDRPVSAIATVTGSMFVFMESFSIYGANVKSTFAGEFSFSWSFTLSLVYLGLVIRDARRGRGFNVWAGVVLALVALTHVVTTIAVVVVSLPLLIRRRGWLTLSGSWLLGFALSAFWALPLAVRILQGMTTSMNWFPVRGLLGEGSSPQIVTTTLPGELVPFFVLAIIGAVWTLLRREDVAVLLTMTVVPAFVYWLFAELEIRELYNARFLPYWFAGIFILAGITIGLGVSALARGLSQRRQGIGVLGGLAMFVLTGALLAGIHDLPGWVNWNYEGYEGKDAWPEFEAYLEAIDELPPGRVMWEAASGDYGKFGTPLALMLTPYFSDAHPSMEGLFFESSLTTPFHFLNASEVSASPSNPKAGLDYRSLDLERALPHLALYDVRYYVAWSERAIEEARGHDAYREIGPAGPWTVFELPESSLVDVAEFQPVVYDGPLSDEDWAVEWYGYEDVTELDLWVTADGPEAWRRVDEVADRLRARRPYDATAAEVTDVVIDDHDHRISFTTTAVGVPHLVKVSYFPNWTASGADGPYRVAPSLMVVVPTEENVVLQFERKSAEIFGMALTIGSVLGLAAWVVRRRRTGSIA
jgi:hypothetical protein